MSLISGQLDVQERQRSDWRQTRMHMEAMWSDNASRKYLDVIDELDQADREYGHALAELDGTFDQADKLLGPLP